MRVAWVLDANRVAIELSGPFAKAGASQTDNDSSNPPEIFHKNIFLLKTLIEKQYIAIEICLFNLSWFYQGTQDGKTKKSLCTGNFDPLRCSRKFKFFTVLVLKLKKVLVLLNRI